MTKIAIMSTDYFEEVELIKPMQLLAEAGAVIEVLAPHSGTIQGLHHVEPAKAITVTRTIAEANPAEYDAVVLPGGVVNADKLRMDEDARNFIKRIFTGGKVVAAICHAPWLLVSTELVRDRQLTSYYTLQDDIRHAGGNWQDKPVVIDDTIITSRKPDDIPEFVEAIKEKLRLTKPGA